MDIDYKKPVNELVVDLINRDNPQLPFPIKYDECFFGLPVAWSAAGDFRNTEVSVTPRPNSPYIGAFKVRYRRLRTNLLFPEGIWMDNWYVDANITISDFVAAVNFRTGMQLKWSDTAHPAATSLTTVYRSRLSVSNFAMHGSNLAFIGTPIFHYAGKYPVDLHVPADANVLVHWDGVPRDETDPLRRYTLYGHDFTAWADYLETWSTSAVKNFATIDSDLISLVQYLADVSGQPFHLGNNGDTWDLYGAYGLRSINLASTPAGANGADYNRVVSIYRPAKTGNIPDQLFLHYKV